MILEILSHSGKIRDDRDTKFREVIGRADTAAHEYLR
jgi:hypothetical protein